MYTRNNNNNNPSDYYSSSSAPPINEDDELNDNNNTTNTNNTYNNNNNNLNNNNNMDNSNNNNENNNFRSPSPTFSSISCATSITTNTVNPELLECQICLEIVTDNRECKKCGAIYCKECLAAWFKNNNKNCPHCNAQPVFLEKDFSLNQFVQRLVDNLDVTCPNQMNGCDLKIVKRGNLKEHLEKFCNGRIINCENEKFGCKWKGCIKDYKYHQENDCLFCKVEIKNCLQKLQEKIEALTLENQELKERLKRSTFNNNNIVTTTTSGGINGGGIVGGNNGVVVNVENVGVVDPYGNASAPQVLLNNNNNNNLYNNNNQQLNNSQLLNNLMNNSFVNGVGSNSSSGSSGVNSPILNTSVLQPTGINNSINIMNNNTSSGINNMQQSFLSGFVNNTFLRKKYKVIGTLQWTRYNGMYFNNNNQYQNYGYSSGIGGSSGLQSPFEFVFEVDQDGNIVNTLSFSNNNNNYYSDHQMNSSINSNNSNLMYTSSLMQQQNQQKRITGTLKGNTLNFVEISTMDGKETNYWGNITPPSNKIYLTFQSMGYYNNSGYIDGYFYSL